MDKQKLLYYCTLRDDWMRTLIFLMGIGITTGVIFHDYPGHNHLDSLHNLLREDATTIEHEPLVPSDWIIGGEDSTRAGANVNYFPTISPTEDNVKPVSGFYYLHSGLPPPDEKVRLVNGFYDLGAGLSPPSATMHLPSSLKFMHLPLFIITSFPIAFPDTHLRHLVVFRYISQLQTYFSAISRAYNVGPYENMTASVSALC